jgi:hypothetical protein
MQASVRYEHWIADPTAHTAAEWRTLAAELDASPGLSSRDRAREAAAIADNLAAGRTARLAPIAARRRR